MQYKSVVVSSCRCVRCLPLTLIQASCRSQATNGTDSKDMDSTARKAANLNVLKRQDADITDIMDSASFVVIYRFDDAIQAWVSFEQEVSIAVLLTPLGKERRRRNHVHIQTIQDTTIWILCHE